MEQHIAELSRRQRQQGIDVFQAFCIGDLQGETGVQVLAGWPILHLWPHAVRDFIFYLAVCIQALRRGLSADVVHVHGDWSAYLFGAALKRVLRARVLFASMHGHASTDVARRWLYRIATVGVDGGYATGAREAIFLSEISGRDWVHVTSGIADVFFERNVSNAPELIDVVVVGSLLPVKGLELALEVARILPHRQFRFVGDGPDRQRLFALAAGLANCVFVGRLEPKAVAETLRASRLLLSTSFREGTPTAILEAMASGLAIVATTSNDYQALIESEGGAVVLSRSAIEVAETVESFLSDETRLCRARAHNYRVASHYSWGNVSRRVSELMRRALSLQSAR